MVDRAAKRAEGKGAGYDRWAAVHNLKQMAATVAAYGQYGYSPEELDAALVSANADLQDSTAKLKALDAAIREKKELQTQALAYAKTKPARDGLKAQKTEKARSAYRERHESDFIIADAATRYFRAHGVSKLPSHKALQAEIEQLTAEKNAHYNEYREKKARVKELHTVKSNPFSNPARRERQREKSTNMSVKNPPRNDTKTGVCPAPYPQYCPPLKQGAQRRKSPKMTPRNYIFLPTYPLIPAETAERREKCHA